MSAADTRFDLLTETTGVPISREGASMMYTRYHQAAQLARGKRVLEVGAGSGQGLGLIAKQAKFTVGGDFDPRLAAAGHAHYGARVPFVRLSAEDLPFRAGSFDMVLLFEAAYYVPSVEKALDEFSRVLSPGGVVMVVNANPERPDFIASPHSHHYHTSDDLRAAMQARGFEVTIEGAYRIEERGTLGKAVSGARQVLSKLGLVPRTLWARAILKRIVYGKLEKLPPEIPENFAPLGERWVHEGGRLPNAKVFYATGRRRAD
jgi:SAM-dependent methyltransferase